MTQYNKALHSDRQSVASFAIVQPQRFWQPVSKPPPVSKICDGLSGFQRAQLGNHGVPGLDGFGDGLRFFLARRRNRRAALPAYGTYDEVDDFVMPVGGAASSALHVCFSATSAMPHAHNADGMRCWRDMGHG